MRARTARPPGFQKSRRAQGRAWGSGPCPLLTGDSVDLLARKVVDPEVLDEGERLVGVDPELGNAQDQGQDDEEGGKGGEPRADPAHEGCSFGRKGGKPGALGFQDGTARLTANREQSNVVPVAGRP